MLPSTLQRRTRSVIAVTYSHNFYPKALVLENWGVHLDDHNQNRRPEGNSATIGGARRRVSGRGLPKYQDLATKREVTIGPLELGWLMHWLVGLVYVPVKAPTVHLQVLTGTSLRLVGGLDPSLGILEAIVRQQRGKGVGEIFLSHRLWRGGYFQNIYHQPLVRTTTKRLVCRKFTWDHRRRVGVFHSDTCAGNFWWITHHY